jgi:hypothetical protein
MKTTKATVKPVKMTSTGTKGAKAMPKEQAVGLKPAVMKRGAAKAGAMPKVEGANIYGKKDKK